MSVTTIRATSRRLLASGAVLVLGASLAPVASSASSHREAPLIASEPQLDNTDVYAFVSPDRADTVTLIANWIPFEEPSGGPNFYPFSDEARYDIHIDNDHDAVEDITYRWTFDSTYQNEDTFLYNTGAVTSLTDEHLNYRQTYTLERIVDGVATAIVTNGRVAPSHVGGASMPDYQALRNESITDTPGGGKTFAGQADEPFFLDLRVFDLLYGGDLSEVGTDTASGFNVNALAIQVPKTDLVLAGDATANPIIGIWSTTSVPSMTVRAADGTSTVSGDFVQVSRLGMPLVNEVVVPVGSKDLFNSSKPADDGQFLSKVEDPEVPKLIEAIYGIPAPETPRDDLVAVFLTGVEGLNQPANVTPSEQIRLNTSIAPGANPKRLGVLDGDNAGFPNGRRLIDDVVDIELQALEGELRDNPNDLGDGVNANDVAFGSTFPYLALPHSGSSTRTARSGSSGGGSNSGAPADAPQGGVATGAGGATITVPTAAVTTAGLAGLLLLAAGFLLRRRTVVS